MAAAAGAAAAPAEAALTGTATREPEAVTYWGPRDPRTTQEVVHRVVLRTALQAESVEFSAPSLNLEIDGPGTLTAQGAASSTTVSQGRRGRDACTTTTGPFADGRYRLDLPAGATTVISFRQRVALHGAPAAVAALRQVWTFVRAAHAAAPALRLQEAPVTLVGLRPAALALRVGLTASGRSVGARRELRVTPRSDLALSGWLDPGRAGERVTIWGYVPGRAKPQRIGTTRTDRHGRFLLARWRPRRVGLHELWASWDGVAGRVEAARSPCSGPRVVVR